MRIKNVNPMAMSINPQLNCGVLAGSHFHTSACYDYQGKEKTKMEGQVISPEFKEDKGKKFDAGKPMIGLISAYAIEEEAKVMTFGAAKYGFHNWKAGLSWLRVISAVLRHIFAFLRGEDFDPETGIHHLAHARCGLAFILEYTQTHPEKDDRSK